MNTGNANPAYIHGHTSGGKFTPEYHTWASMLTRCYNPKSIHYDRYGGRGIRVCARWKTFTNFLADMGARPADKSLDRIDNEKGYSPANCRWATRSEQINNRCKTKLPSNIRKRKILARCTRPTKLTTLIRIMGVHPELTRSEVRDLEVAGKLSSRPIPTESGSRARTKLLWRTT